MDYDPNGDYVRTWVTELANIPGGKQGSSQKTPKLKKGLIILNVIGRERGGSFLDPRLILITFR